MKGMYAKGTAARSDRSFGRLCPCGGRARWHSTARQGQWAAIPDTHAGSRPGPRPGSSRRPGEERQLPLHPFSMSPDELVATAVQAGRPGYQNCGVKLTTQLAAEDRKSTRLNSSHV